MNPLGYIDDVFQSFRFLPFNKDLNFQLSEKCYLGSIRISVVLAIMLQCFFIHKIKDLNKTLQIKDKTIQY